MEKVAEEVKFRREAKKLQKKHNRLEKVVEQIFQVYLTKRCKMYTIYGKGSGVDHFYKKEYCRLIFANKDYSR